HHPPLPPTHHNPTPGAPGAPWCPPRLADAPPPGSRTKGPEARVPAPGVAGESPGRAAGTCGWRCPGKGAVTCCVSNCEHILALRSTGMHAVWHDIERRAPGDHPPGGPRHDALDDDADDAASAEPLSARDTSGVG